MAVNTTTAAVSVYIHTFNCAKELIDIPSFSSQLFTNLPPSTPLPDLLVLNLQEIAPIPHSLIGGSFLVPYFTRFYHAVQKGARKVSNDENTTGPIYAPVAARNLGLTGIIILAKDPTLIRNIQTGGIGVGAWEIGSKGAIGVRFTYGTEGAETELTFISAHLAAMEGALLRRNQDWKNIVRGLVFSSSNQEKSPQPKTTNSTTPSQEQVEQAEGEEEEPLLSTSEPTSTLTHQENNSLFRPTSHLFFSGDLNYRTSLLPPHPDDYLTTFPQPHTSYNNLLSSDQLTTERLSHRTLHGLTEEKITFPPTYKYTSDSPILADDTEIEHWDWAQHRWPSWTDRILYLSFPSWIPQPSNSQQKLEITPQNYNSLPLLPTSDHRAVTLYLTVPLIPIPPPPPSNTSNSTDPRISPPFEIERNWKANREKARKLELLVGFALWFTSTKEGGTILAAVGIALVGGTLLARAWYE